MSVTSRVVRRVVRRNATAAWSAVLIAQVLLVVTARVLGARVRRGEPDPDGGFTTVEWVVLLVIIAGAAAAVATLIYNWITAKARSVTTQ